MGVYIKGMKMPDRCVTSWLVHCEWYERYGGDYESVHACRLTGAIGIKDADKRRPAICPFTEVKEPHGRLIDEDALFSRWSDHIGTYYDYDEISDAPTVIEAEG